MRRNTSLPSIVMVYKRASNNLNSNSFCRKELDSISFLFDTRQADKGRHAEQLQASPARLTFALHLDVDRCTKRWPYQACANGNTGSSSPPRGHDHGQAYGQPGSPSHESQHQELGPPTSRSERAGNKLGRFYNHPVTALARKGVVSAAKYVSKPITKNIDPSTKSNVKSAFSNFGHSVAHASPSMEKFTGHFKKGKADRAKEFNDHMDSIGF